MSGNQTTYNGIGFFGALTLLFIGLKLGGIIDWSWFWVLSPIIFSLGFAIIFFLIILIIVISNKRF